MTAVPRRQHVREEEAEHTAREGTGKREKEGVKERGPEGHLSISAGVKWAGACAVLLRTAALSLTPDAAGAAHPCTANVEATAGVPRRGGGVRSFAPRRGPSRSSRPYVLIWSERGNGRCHRLMENAKTRASSLAISNFRTRNARPSCDPSSSTDTSNASFTGIICTVLSHCRFVDRLHS